MDDASTPCAPCNLIEAWISVVWMQVLSVRRRIPNQWPYIPTAVEARDPIFDDEFLTLTDLVDEIR